MIINNYEPFSTLFTKTLRRVSKVADLLYRNPKQTFRTAILSLFSGEGFFVVLKYSNTASTLRREVCFEYLHPTDPHATYFFLKPQFLRHNDVASCGVSQNR